MEREKIKLERTDLRQNDIQFTSSAGNPLVRGDGETIYVCWNCSDILFELYPPIEAQAGRRRVAACMKCGKLNRFPRRDSSETIP